MTGAVVGEHPLDRDPALGEEAEGSGHEPRGGLLALVGQDLGVGEPRAVVDRGVHEIVAVTRCRLGDAARL
jgi:hypothetical protein